MPVSLLWVVKKFPTSSQVLCSWDLLELKQKIWKNYKNNPICSLVPVICLYSVYSVWSSGKSINQDFCFCSVFLFDQRSPSPRGSNPHHALRCAPCAFGQHLALFSLLVRLRKCWELPGLFQRKLLLMHPPWFIDIFFLFHTYCVSMVLTFYL